MSSPPKPVLEHLYEQGLSTAEIARLPGVELSQSAVYERLRSCGAIERRRQRDEAVAREVVSLYRRGLSVRQIAGFGRLQVSRSTVLRILHRSETPMRVSPHRTDVDDRDLVRWYEQDLLSLREIAARVHMTARGVHRRLVQAGAQLRPPGRCPAVVLARR